MQALKKSSSMWYFHLPSIQFPPEKNKVLNVAKSQNIFSCSVHFQRKEPKHWFENSIFLPASMTTLVSALTFLTLPKDKPKAFNFLEKLTWLSF